MPKFRPQVRHRVKFEPRSQRDSRDYVLIVALSHFPGRKPAVCLYYQENTRIRNSFQQAVTEHLLCARPS